MMSGAPSPVQPVGPFLAAAPKDAVTTSLGAARVWATLGQGIVSEVYWPSTGEPQIRDIGFIVAGDGWWVEVKANGRYIVTAPDPMRRWQPSLTPAPRSIRFSLSFRWCPTRRGMFC